MAMTMAATAAVRLIEVEEEAAAIIEAEAAVDHGIAVASLTEVLIAAEGQIITTMTATLSPWEILHDVTTELELEQ